MNKQEQAIKLLVKYFGGIETKKPTLFHSIRVGTFLWNEGYSEDIQIAGFLHDILEDTEITEDEIENKFGSFVLDLVKAGSKNKSLPKSEIQADIVNRCNNLGINGLVVKISDVYDNLKYYKSIKKFSEIERCKRISNLIIKTSSYNKLDHFMKRILDEIINY